VEIRRSAQRSRRPADLTKQRALNFAPGTEPLYTNSHYTLLAMVIQRVSGKPLRVFAEERIFRPLGGGLRIGRYRGLRTVAHDGADAGYRSDVVAFPDQRLAIVALCNSGAIAPGILTHKVADLYLGDRMAAEAANAETAAAKVPEASGVALAALAGTWWCAKEDAIVRLTVKDGALRVDGSPDQLQPIGGGVFRVNASTGLTHEWRFSTPANGTSELRITDAWPMPRVFTRLTAPVPSASTLAAYAGRYRSDEVGMNYTVRVDDGKLSLRWDREMSLTLEAVGGDHFIDGIYTVTFTRGASGDVNGLTISTRRVRRLRAERTTS
jgi:CubicO group peptidase (beta-lactamase class C family)